MKNPISDLLKLAISHEKATSLKDRQLTKMQAGKVRKVLAQANQESIKQRIGVKIEN